MEIKHLSQLSTNNVKIKVLPTLPTIKKIISFNSNLDGNYFSISEGTFRVYSNINNEIIDYVLCSIIDENYDLLEIINYLEEVNNFSETEIYLLEKVIIDIRDEFLLLCKNVLRLSEQDLLINYIVSQIDLYKMIFIKRSIAKEFLL